MVWRRMCTTENKRGISNDNHDIKSGRYGLKKSIEKWFGIVPYEAFEARNMIITRSTTKMMMTQAEQH